MNGNGAHPPQSAKPVWPWWLSTGHREPGETRQLNRRFWDESFDRLDQYLQQLKKEEKDNDPEP